ncbi:MAG: hypothetical protein ABFS46_06180 [Myxococcota bacterium]
MGDARQLRIYSTFDGDAELDEPIERFVISLAERVDGLQDAQLIGDLEGLAKLAAELRDDAAKLGYPQLVEASASLVDTCLAGHAEEALEQLVTITEIAQAVRLGHRGAF